MSFTTHSLGVSIKVSPELKASLKSRAFSSNGATNANPQLVKLVPLSRHKVVQTTSSEPDEDANDPRISIDDHDNCDVYDEHKNIEFEEKPYVPVSAPRSLDEIGFDDDDERMQSEDELSHSPPPNLPVVLVNLERLCGYVPNSKTELDAVVDQVKAALNEDEFDERVTELFEMNIVRHGTNSYAVSDSNRTLKMDYPEFLCPPDGRILSTSRVWKKLSRTHSIQVVTRILNHLKNCNRSLIWKNDMHDELLGLIRGEEEAIREEKLERWRLSDRKAKLDKLYQVRETFYHRLEMARIKLEQLEDEREQNVSRHQGRGLQALDLQTNIFATATSDEIVQSSLLEAVDHQSEGSSNDESCTDDTSDELDGMDANNQDLRAENVTTEAFVHMEQISHGAEDSAAKKSRRRRVRKIYRKNLENAAQQAWEKQKIDEALAEEEHLFELYTTQELLMAQAAVQSLEVRMDQVDDLLESLQDEEWADEEDGFKPKDKNADSSTDNELSLLDQILAMILGTLSPEQNDFEDATNEPDEVHCQFLRKEHTEIIVSWKDYFGRLPMMSIETSRPDEWDDNKGQVDSKQIQSSLTLRAELGIEDNDEEWDHDDHDLEDDSNTAANEKPYKTATNPSARSGGLRPGGSTKR